MARSDPAYMRAYRAAKPAAYERDLRQARTYRKAMKMLRERHRDEFDALYAALIDGRDGAC